MAADSVPTPDPTVLTTDALRREIKASTDLTAAKLASLGDSIEQTQKYLDTKIDGNAALSEERHAHTRREFISEEARRIEHKNDTQKAVDAAFAAAKDMVAAQTASSDKAISKSEAATSDQVKAVLAMLDDLKARVVILETQKSTTVENRGEGRASVGMIVGVVGVAFAFLSLIVVAANFLSVAR